nr:hypothetical protein [Tanacetum cinerariifolium]
VVIALAFPFGFGIVLLGRELELDEILLISLKVVEFELKVIHISIVCCGVGLEFALRNRVLLWRCFKIKILLWTADEIPVDASG